MTASNLPWTPTLRWTQEPLPLDNPTLLLDKALDWSIAFAPTLIGALLVLVLGTILAKVLRRVMVKLIDKAGVDATLSKFLSNIAYMLMMALVIITALGQLGVPTGSFAAILAAAGLAIGLALQDSLGNFASGVMLMLFRPFKVDDYVEAGGHAGVVEEILVFSTRMRTGDNKQITIPNGSIISGSITNYSAKDTRRIDMVFGIGYDDDIRKAKAVLERVVNSDPRVLAEPSPTIAVSELADSSVNFVVRPWVKTDDYWPTRFDLIETIKIEFDQQGISIPFPQQDVHMHPVA